MTLQITVYSTPHCVKCDRTKKQLDKLGLEYTSIDITEDADAYTYATSLNPDYRVAPIVTVTRPDGTMSHWSDYRYDNIAALANL
ncbi:NrdH-redoxin [Rhodococcus hoagii]|uniref:NrdH-redoxin n=1 Tax=Rhodococcus hoagii TaxID=43767 RepID=A0A9Q5EYJ8_RHOHA|nr:NrdH-redoxin [Prescottella equi]MBM4708670.1 NrdH-redoxin [Prescottella equi]NKT77297.1 NrdH-redoxin [Prescottella equi]NKZ81084.1 NrdH-redoxin [Prescottella equi]